jgi:1-acyl-sn-glycerol-3-phosphate acyltransferase
LPDRMSQPKEFVQPEEHESAVVLTEEPPRPQLPLGIRIAGYCFFLPLVALATAFFGTLSLLCGLWDKTGRQQHWIARQWARVLLVIALSPVKIEGLEHLQPLRRPGTRRPLAVFASNHLSYYDTPMLFSRLPFQFRILAKAPLWKIPFIGWYLQRSGQVPIDQSSARAGVASLMRGVKTLEGGLPLMIFPEGGRAATGQLKEMVAGAAWMAIKAQVPLVPITLIGTYELLPIHVYALRPRPLKIVIGTPLSTEGLSTRDAEALTQRLRSVIHETYIANHG